MCAIYAVGTLAVEPPKQVTYPSGGGKIDAQDRTELGLSEQNTCLLHTHTQFGLIAGGNLSCR